MDGLFEKLMLARQALFNDGSIKVFGHRVALGGDWMGVYIGRINNTEKVRTVYKDAKMASYEFYLRLGKAYSFSAADYLRWVADLSDFGGWGIPKWADADKDNKRGMFTVTDAPVGAFLKGKVDAPCDHILRGMMAGGAKAGFKTEIDVVELECAALGKKECRFVMDTPENLKSKHKDLYRVQVGDLLQEPVRAVE